MINRMRPQMRYAACLLLIFVVAAAVHGQSDDEKAVQSAVESFLTRLGDHQFDALDADFTPKAVIIVTRQRAGSTEWANSYQTAEEWIAGLRKNTIPRHSASQFPM